jgi:hypothetical protein
MSPFVEIVFDCLPLRSVERLDIPLDASPGFRAQCERIKRAVEKNGMHNSYYLHHGHCTFRLTNDDKVGLIALRFEGTVLTDTDDLKTIQADLEAEISEETCEWLTAPIVAWFQETVQRAVMVEFDRYISAGDLQKTIQRIAKLQEAMDARGGFIGMGL